MAHDATKILLGTTQSSFKVVEDYDENPATFLPGLAVRLSSSGALSLTSGSKIGISLGKSLSDTNRTAVLKKGLRVPLLLEAAPARGEVTIEEYANLVDAGNDTLKVGATTFTFKTSAPDAADVLCPASGSNNAAVAGNLAAKINAHTVAGALFIAVAVGAVVTITAKNNATAGSSIDLVYSDEGDSTVGLSVDAITFTGGNVATDFVVVGGPVYISDTTGKADDPSSAATISNAIYASLPMTGVNESGVEVAACVLVDMLGGL